jgi:CcmD family protein
MIAYAVSIKYMLAGYAAIFIVLTVYLVSLFVRWQRLKRDLQSLEDLEKPQ